MNVLTEGGKLVAIKILIDRIIFEHGSLSPSQRRHLQAEIEHELTHLLTINGIPDSLRFGAAISNLSITLNSLSSPTYSARLGQNIALSIYHELERKTV